MSGGEGLERLMAEAQLNVWDLLRKCNANGKATQYRLRVLLPKRSSLLRTHLLPRKTLGEGRVVCRLSRDTEEVDRVL